MAMLRPSKRPLERKFGEEVVTDRTITIQKTYQSKATTWIFQIDEGKPNDPPPFNSGLVARARVENNLHRVSVPFSERSAGFVWFFSFLVKFAQIKKQQGNVISFLFCRNH
jgi:hypothetical protein